MECDVEDENSGQVFSVGTRVVVKDALSPNEYISGIVSSHPKRSSDPECKEYFYEILVDFSDDILFGGQGYKRVCVSSSCLSLV
ncbi:hypothetical protein [Paraglaciecola marina]|uniref:hypothetical protein n=1 Tax=Paraglaciecola marina TaxID=2500157 RepID=UPI00105C7E9E|nr:hypothetical protein [Paraglaciecola marina]